jgi:hypothetical protein
LFKHIGSGSGRAAGTRSKNWALAFTLFCWLLPTPSWADTEAPPPPELTDSTVEDAIGTFDEEGRLHNETEKTYTLPEIGIFIGYFPKTDSLSTGMSVEIVDRQHRRGALNKFKWDLVIAEQRLGVSAGWKIVPVIDLNLMIFYTRDFNHDRYVWGLGLGLIKF